MLAQAKPYYRAVMLTVSCRVTDYYAEFDRIQHSYANQNPQILNLFTYGKHSDRIQFGPHDLVYPDIPEGFKPHMLNKTYAALADIERMYDYDFLIRTNASTFWDFERVLRRLDTLPSTRCLAGSEGILEPRQLHGVALVLSRDVVQQLLTIPEQVAARATTESEDRVLTKLVEQDLQIPRTVQPNICYITNQLSFDASEIDHYIKRAQKHNLDHFRVKNVPHIPGQKMDLQRREVDHQVLKYLIKQFYNISLD